MDRAEVVSKIAERIADIRHRFGVEEIAIFGSAARDALRPESDIDVLVRFASPATLPRYMGLKFYLEELLGRSVDLVTDKALRSEFRPRIEREALIVD